MFLLICSADKKKPPLPLDYSKVTFRNLVIEVKYQAMFEGRDIGDAMSVINSFLDYEASIKPTEKEMSQILLKISDGWKDNEEIVRVREKLLEITSLN